MQGIFDLFLSLLLLFAALGLTLSIIVSTLTRILVDIFTEAVKRFKNKKILLVKVKRKEGHLKLQKGAELIERN